MPDSHTCLLVAVIALVTALLRFFPFLLWSGRRKPPKRIEKFSRVLPGAITGMLVVYCLKDVTLQSAADFLPELLASLVVVGSYALKRSTLWSILLGTVSYMLLVQLVF